MDTVKVKYSGKEKIRFRHGDVSMDFAAGEEKEVPIYLAEELLGTETVQRKWKKDGKFAGERRVALFEQVLSEKADDGEETKGETE